MASTPSLPSTTALRVFLAVAEHGSTAKAAAGVNLTQSAVSKQIQALEHHLGTLLFERARQGLRLTETGLIYRPFVEAALEQLARGVRRVNERARARQPIRLHMPAIVGERWLMPGFPAFSSSHPEIDVQFTNFVSEHESEEPDVDIRHGAGPWKGWHAEYLFGRDIALVAAPRLIQRLGGRLLAADVPRLTFLQHFQVPAYWAEFTEAYGMRGAVPAQSIRYGYLSVIVRGAVAGLGVALAPRCFVADELRSGELVNPGDLGFRSAQAYWALARRRAMRRGSGVLMKWLASEAVRYRTSHD